MSSVSPGVSCASCVCPVYPVFLCTSGKLFSIDLLDANNGEIRATLFKEAADKWFPILEQGQVYTISGGRLKVAGRWGTGMEGALVG